MTKQQRKIAFVTGANQGLGFALVRGLCQRWGDEGIIYLTARDEERGEQAVATLEAEGLHPHFHLLDVAVDASVKAFADYLNEIYGGVDIAISNAAARIVKDIPQTEQVEAFINTNNHGTYRILNHITPLLNDGGRLIVVASSFGSLRHLNPSLHGRFAFESMTLEEVEAVMDDYVIAVTTGNATKQGWPDWINIPSKIGQVAAVKVLAHQYRDVHVERNILVNAACPGLIDTDASRPWFDNMNQAASPDDAARDVLWLTEIAGANAPYGELVQHRKILPFR
jgi:carbonyl reductase 1